MATFVIEIPHSPEECSAAIDAESVHARTGEAAAATYWGCEDGVHTTWIVDEFESQGAARSLVPKLLGDTARVVQVGTARRAVKNDTGTRKRSRDLVTFCRLTRSTRHEGLPDLHAGSRISQSDQTPSSPQVLSGRAKPTGCQRIVSSDPYRVAEAECAGWMAF